MLIVYKIGAQPEQKIICRDSQQIAKFSHAEYISEVRIYNRDDADLVQQFMLHHGLDEITVGIHDKFAIEWVRDIKVPTNATPVKLNIHHNERYYLYPENVSSATYMETVKPVDVQSTFIPVTYTWIIFGHLSELFQMCRKNVTVLNLRYVHDPNVPFADVSMSGLSCGCLYVAGITESRFLELIGCFRQIDTLTIPGCVANLIPTDLRVARIKIENKGRSIDIRPITANPHITGIVLRSKTHVTFDWNHTTLRYINICSVTNATPVSEYLNNNKQLFNKFIWETQTF